MEKNYHSQFDADDLESYRNNSVTGDDNAQKSKDKVRSTLFSKTCEISIEFSVFLYFQLDFQLYFLTLESHFFTKQLQKHKNNHNVIDKNLAAIKLRCYTTLLMQYQNS